MELAMDNHPSVCEIFSHGSFHVFKDVSLFSKMNLICMSEHMNKWN